MPRNLSIDEREHGPADRAGDVELGTNALWRVGTQPAVEDGDPVAASLRSTPRATAPSPIRSMSPRVAATRKHHREARSAIPQ
jgi:hypothetical protein